MDGDKELTQAIQRSRRWRSADPNAGVDLRLTHPNLYRSLMTRAVLVFALGLNFLILTPAFDPLGVPKLASGIVFTAVGVAKLITLNMAGDLRRLRLATAASVFIMFTYGVLQTAAYFQLHQTSLMSPILFFGSAVGEFWLLIEPFTNPATQKTDAR